MQGNLRIICANEATSTIFSKVKSLLLKLGTKDIAMEEILPYWKENACSVFTCRFKYVCSNIDQLFEELSSISGSTQTSVIYDNTGVEISCYNALQAITCNHDLFFAVCFLTPEKYSN